MTGKIVVGARLGSIVDRNPKLWRFCGDCVQTLSAAFELATVKYPSNFLFLAAFAAFLRKSSDAATGPSYRVFLTSFAINSNIGDVSSRAESQIVFSNILGIALGLFLSKLVQNNLTAAIQCYITLASLHIYFTYKSVDNIALRTFNGHRLCIVLSHYIKTQTVLDHYQVSEREDMFKAAQNFNVFLRNTVSCELGIDLLEFVESGRDVSRVVTLYESERYMLGFNNEKIGILFREDVEMTDVLSAFLQALKLDELRGEMKRGIGENVNRNEAWNLMKESLKWTQKCRDDLISQMQDKNWGKIRIGNSNNF